jgi:hypothetical protein
MNAQEQFTPLSCGKNLAGQHDGTHPPEVADGDETGEHHNGQHYGNQQEQDIITRVYGRKAEGEG